jgi:endoglycosylceramidase
MGATAGGTARAASAPLAPSTPSVGGWAGAGMTQAPGGPYLTDSLGRRLSLHGVNLVGKCGGGAVDTKAAGTPCVGPSAGPRLAYVLSPAARDPGRRFTSADAHTLARLGFNMVRLGVLWEGLEPGPSGAGPNQARYCAPHRVGAPFPVLGRDDPYDPAAVRAYLARTDRIVAELAQAGLRVIVDMHSDVWGSAFSLAGGLTPWNGEGAPGWATCTGGRRFVPPPGWGSAYFAPAVQTALHHFWANDVRADLQAQYARVWGAVAAHYRGDPDVIGYEVFNEPNDYLVRHFDPELQCAYGGPANEPKSCAAVHMDALPDGLIGAIQAADPSHVVFYEPSGDADFGTPETLGIDEPLRFPRLALAFHVYGAIPAQLRQTLAERDRTQTDQPDGPAWIMDEFGASNNAPLSTKTVDAADGMNLSWDYWAAMQLHDPTGGSASEGLLDQVTRKPYPPMAGALAVAYPWATAGRPGASSLNRRTGTFRYRYAADPRVSAPTEIEVPRSAYPGGYGVVVTGARVVSARDASLLELSDDAGASEVSVTVYRRR